MKRFYFSLVVAGMFVFASCSGSESSADSAATDSAADTTTESAKPEEEVSAIFDKLAKENDSTKTAATDTAAAE